ncbi:MAG: hypothetical protein LBF74_05645 [Treponema sp.]|jgi:hypothetical protein|nr:hypothetical protein [Treponema sp.]
MSLDKTLDISIKISMPGHLRERWEKFTYDRGYGKGPFLRSFIEAITDPVRGPRIEQIMRAESAPATEGAG